MSEETMPEKQVENTSSHIENEWKSETIGKLSAALAKAQGEMKGATSKSTNPFFNSSYADLHTVIEACKPHLSKEEIAFVQGNRFVNGIFFVVTKLIHSSGEWLSSEMALPIPKGAGPQQIGSLNSYGRRYTLASMSGIAQYDDDANKAQGLDSKVKPVNQ